MRLRLRCAAAHLSCSFYKFFALINTDGVAAAAAASAAVAAAAAAKKLLCQKGFGKKKFGVNCRRV